MLFWFGMALFGCIDMIWSFSICLVWLYSTQCVRLDMASGMTREQISNCRGETMPDETRPRISFLLGRISDQSLQDFKSLQI